jgi:hypothetical protein
MLVAPVESIFGPPALDELPLAARRQPEELAKTLADLLNEFLSFEYLDVLVFIKDDDSRVAPVVFSCRAGRTAEAHF